MELEDYIIELSKELKTLAPKDQVLADLMNEIYIHGLEKLNLDQLNLLEDVLDTRVFTSK